MNKQQKFEILKELLLSSYANYMNAVRNTSYDDLNDLESNLKSMEVYIQSVACNCAYRDFINQHRIANSNRRQNRDKK